MKRRFQLRPHLLLLTLLCVLPVSSVAARADSAKSKQPPRLGREFLLTVGQSVAIKSTKLSIKFVAVSEDSRCPSDVTCVWAGNAKVQLQVRNGRTGKTLTLNSNTTTPPPSNGSFNGYQVELIELSPYPRTTAKIAPGSYVVKLMVNKS